jgi:hypothetical protein
MLLKYSSSNAGPYNELAYLPGKFKPGKCRSPVFSIQRIWVDSEASVQGGRINWGLPKVRSEPAWLCIRAPAAAEAAVPLRVPFYPV